MAGAKLDFPRYVNDYRLFVVFPLDQVVVFLGTIIASFWIYHLFMWFILAFFLSIPTGFYTYFAYKRIKTETTRGFLFHTAYVLGLVSLNPPKQDEEMQDMDVESFLPEGYETEFLD